MKTRHYFMERAARDYAARQPKACIIDVGGEEPFEVRETIKPVVTPGETLLALYQRGVELSE